MSAIKFEQVLKRYYGATSEEEGDTFQHWLTKFELVSGIQGWNEEKQREYMPLFFEGPAWDVYESLPAATTATKGALVTAMEAAFSPTKSDAWVQFQARDFREGTDPSTAPSVLAERFVAGLPSSAAEQIRLLAAPEGELDLSKAVLRARTLLPQNMHSATVVAGTNSRQAGHPYDRSRKDNRNRSQSSRSSKAPISHSKSPRVYVQVQSKLKCVSVLDTGSAISLVSSETLYYSGGRLSGVVAAHVSTTTNVSALPSVLSFSSEASSAVRLSRHVAVQEEFSGTSEASGKNDLRSVKLSMQDFDTWWSKSDGYWTFRWHWKDDQPPLNPIYSRLAKYPVKLTAQQEQQYDQELSSWISSGWLIPYDEKKFGPVKVELPFLPVVQAHKSSSPLRACVDARRLNDLVINTPGYSTISCPDKLRQWRLRCALGPFFVSLSSGAISRLPVCSISHVFWTLHIASDSYVDDIYVADKALVPKVIEQFRLFGLPCLELVDDHGDLCWTRRPDWCGRLTSHYPICDWLRPATSYLKRICCEGLGSNAAWDRPVLPDVKKCCDDVVKRLQVDDPVRGVWSPPSLSSNPTFSLYCDASSLAVGVVITVDKGDGNIVPLEDSCWLVAKRIAWGAKDIILYNDSRTVVGWLNSLLNDTAKVKVSDTAIDDEDGITANVQRLPGNDFDNCDDICLLPRDHGPNVDPRGELSSAPSVKDDSSGGGEEDGGSPAQVLASAAVGTDITVFGQQPSVTLSDQLMDPILADINQLVHDRSLPTSQLPPAYARILPQINVRSDDGVLFYRSVFVMVS
ncbi:hypothetical protein FOZ60_006628 [Perkinsus olseni]|uniref:DUF7047 domain-containing protein n=1 Tax=Perkinsus olseni TaxID=32597 RepID=A0A7J6NNH0_PEROL|nr:hypothetical protein FOZ60_006628 [Perkinsus olseni]